MTGRIRHASLNGARYSQILGVLLCLSCGGCIWGAGGKASVDAFSVADTYPTAEQSQPGLVMELPTAEQLTPLKNVVVVSYYGRHRPAAGNVEFLGAQRIDAADCCIDYPIRLYGLNPFSLVSSDSQPLPGVIVFCEGCRPAGFACDLTTGGPSLASDSPASMYPPCMGCAYRFHAVLYKDTRPFANDVLFASGIETVLNAPERFTNVVEHATRLTRQDRQTVYSQLLEVMEKAGLGPEDAAQCARMRRLLKEKLDALAQPR